MNLAVFGIVFNPEKNQVFQNLFQFFHEHGEIQRVSIYAPFYDQLSGNINGLEKFGKFNSAHEIEHFDMLICLGGDGSILDSLALIKDKRIPVLGINTGRLGFLSSISTEDVEQPLIDIIKGNYITDRRSVIQLGSPSNLFGEVNYALNEVTVHKKDSSSMIIIHTYVDGDYLNSYWADGLIISTPTGSTGYNLSCSGPIIMPGSDVFIITPIAPHNLNVRPLIIPDNKKITLRLEGRDDGFLVALDSRSQAITSDEILTIERADFYFNLVRQQGHSFFSTIRNKLSWGLDSRN
jgi:NAD+ kinase